MIIKSKEKLLTILANKLECFFLYAFQPSLMFLSETWAYQIVAHHLMEAYGLTKKQ